MKGRKKGFDVPRFRYKPCSLYAGGYEGFLNQFSRDQRNWFDISGHSLYAVFVIAEFYCIQSTPGILDISKQIHRSIGHYALIWTKKLSVFRISISNKPSSTVADLISLSIFSQKPLLDFAFFGSNFSNRIF